MERRKFLSVGSLTVFAYLSGCTHGFRSENQDNEEEYTECKDREAIPFIEFPNELQKEIRSAIDGGYSPKNKNIKLDDAVDFETTYIIYNNSYYMGHVNDETLYLKKEQEPKGLISTRSISFRIQSEANVEILYGGEDSFATFNNTETFQNMTWGNYKVNIKHQGGEKETLNISIDENSLDAVVYIEQNDTQIEQAVYDIERCPWSDY